MSAYFSMIFLGFGFGLLHAFDPDHVMAVSNLINRKDRSPRQFARFAAHWAFGHASTLLLAGGLLFGMGVAVPEPLTWVAELSIGVLLIGMGLYFFYQAIIHKWVLQHHQHDGFSHVHLHQKGDVQPEGHGESVAAKHSPALVGVVHGLAGSAPALALVPALVRGEVSEALLYICVFSVGVVASMIAFGLGFGLFQKQLITRFEWGYQGFRHLLALSSVVFGSYWIYQAV